MREIYLSIEQHIKEVLPEIQTIGIWNNQIEDLESNIENNESDIYLPAIFIQLGVEPITYELQSNGLKEATMIVGIHIISETYNQTPLEVLERRERVIETLEGFSNDYYQALDLSSSENDYNFTNVYHDVLNFTTRYYEVKSTEETEEIYIDVDATYYYDDETNVLTEIIEDPEIDNEP